MPIPTRSKSVREPATRDETLSSSSTKPVSGNIARMSRLARPTATHLVPTHARSQSVSRVALQTKPTTTARGLLPAANPTDEAGTKTPSSVAVRRQPSTHATSSERVAVTRKIGDRGVQHERTQSASTINTQPMSTNAPPGQSTGPFSQQFPTSTRTLSITKPAFNNNRQQYSPKKTAPIQQTAQSSARAPGKEVAASALQEELFQLSLVHANSKRNLTDFKHSVRQRMRTMESDIENEEQKISTQYHERQMLINAAAFQRWLCHDGRPLDDRKLEQLSLCLQELADMTSTQGLFTMYQQGFGNWLADVQLSQSTISTSGYCSPHPMSRDRMKHLAEVRHRIAMCIESLSDLADEHSCDLIDGSALPHVIRLHLHLARNMEAYMRESEDIQHAVQANQESEIAIQISALVVEHAQSTNCVQPREALWN